MAIVAATALHGCAPVALEPATIAVGRDTCAHCRMTFVSVATAAQLVAPGDEPLLFDDLACLRDFVAGGATPSDAVAFVADHRTSAWVRAADAVFTRTSLSTPMASGLIAHADAASRDRDQAAATGTPVPKERILP
jgi:copper chaperone NosL